MTGWTARIGQRADGAVAGLFFVIGPLTALAPRGLPVWTILMILAAGASLAARPGEVRFPPPNPRDPLPWLMAGFLVLAAVSITWSPSARAALTVVEIGYEALSAIVLARWIAGAEAASAERAERWFLAGLAAGLALMALNTILDYPVNRRLEHLPSTEDIASTNTPKRTSATFALLIGPATAMLIPRVRRWAWLPLAVFALLAIPADSRSAVFGSVLGLAVWALARLSARTVRRSLAVMVVLAAALAVPAPRLMTGTFDLTSAPWLFGSARHRIEIWDRTARRVPDAPVLGHGIDASRAIKPRPGETSEFEVLTGSLLPLHPHNAFLQLWLELGALGTALATAMMLILLGFTRRLPEPWQSLALGQFACGLFMANTAYGLWQAWWMSAFVAAGGIPILGRRVAASR